MSVEIKMKDKKIEKQKDKIADLQSILKKEQERVKLYAEQLDSVTNGCKPSEMTPIEKIITNNVTLDQINQIRYLLKSGNLQQIVDDDNLVITIQNLFMGFLEGIIPIANPQELAFTAEHKEYMRALEKMRTEKVASYLLENPIPLAEIFSILDMSLKLMTKSYLQFVGPIVK